MIIYHDELILLASKPSGIPVHETKDPNRKNFTEEIKKKLALNQLRTVNRLDLETSGIVVFGLDDTKNSEIDKIISNSEKFYLLIVHGNPNEKFKSECFLKDGNKKVNIVRSGGKKAITEFKKIQYDHKNNLSLLLAKLITGRRHQIRIQIFNEGFPILGEKIYTEISPKEKRCLLHSYAIRFRNFKNEEIIIFDSVPEIFQNYFQVEISKEDLW